MSCFRKRWNSFSVQNIISIFGKKDLPFRGWGRKRSGRFAVLLAKLFHREVLLCEDGFIRSIGLGIDGSPSFSIVKDDISIYYDATKPSRLEKLLDSYDFENDHTLMRQAEEAMILIKKHHISKYNSAPELNASLRKKYRFDEKKKRVMVVAQTAGDASLRYGMAEKFSTLDMIVAAIEENPDTEIYLKVHPDVLSGKKRSDFSINEVKNICIAIEDDINPLSLLEHFDKVYTKTSQMGFEALLLDKACVCFGMPFYAGWGATDDRVHCSRRKRGLKTEEIFAAAYILYTEYFNPYTKKSSDIFDTIDTIIRHRDHSNETEEAFFFGFSLWKQRFMKPFFRSAKKIHFVNAADSTQALNKSLEKGMDKSSVIYIWGKKRFEDIEYFAAEKGIDLKRVEDGFIRSVGLGSDLTRPYSLVIDSRGIYFDPTQESDLEHILNYHSFSENELIRAKALRERIIREKLSKYNTYDTVSLDVPKDRTIILVPGQVEDDASIKYGAPDMSNIKLLQQTRVNASEAYIIYKPHPDVLAGNRVGQVEEGEALRYCDRIVKEVSIDTVLAVCDQVHTMTSLIGFEAIMRGIEVHTYGLPFYAGWGLSIDARECDRRSRRLLIDELAAGTMLCYPDYIDPQTLEPCEVEVTIDGLKQQQVKLSASIFCQKIYQLRHLASRKGQWFMRQLQRFSI